LVPKIKLRWVNRKQYISCKEQFKFYISGSFVQKLEKQECYMSWLNL